MSEHQHHPIDMSRLYELEKQTVLLKHLTADGFILDVGGGGEGIIGRLNGSRVVAVDNIKGELLPLRFLCSRL